jgi:hypothetical protein
MIRIVQLQAGLSRRVALVAEPRLRLIEGVSSLYELAREAAITNRSLISIVEHRAAGAELDYDTVYAGRASWRLVPPIDHPMDPARCLVSGTGLTHLGSAKNRQAMHGATETETDSMKMFRWGVEKGRPAAGTVGIAPEWFYKGNGTILRGHNDPLPVPSYAEDGGEEGEVAGVYLIDDAGRPRRIGMATGNEFSDHKFEKKNYLNLAGSKVRPCSLGPELVLDPKFDSIGGKVTIERAGRTVWTKDIATGESEMCHSLANIEHHHFKFETHRRPGDLHVHFYGACALSFGDGVQLKDGDVMVVGFAGFGRPLRNPLAVAKSPETPMIISPLA